MPEAKLFVGEFKLRQAVCEDETGLLKVWAKLKIEMASVVSVNTHKNSMSLLKIDLGFGLHIAPRVIQVATLG